jgi:uncharacterized protein YjgD (DUF1641 family)
MSSFDKLVDQAYSDLKATCSGVRNDYFGLIYLESEHDIPREKAINQISFSGNDYGIDGFHFDKSRKNLYIFQFKYTISHAQFKESLQRLIESGLEVAFISPNIDNSKNQIITQLRSCMVENRALIEQVCIRFVFLGDPAEAERSQVLDKLREDLENKKYLIDKFFDEKQVTMVVDFRSITGKIGTTTDQKKTHKYNLPINDMFSQQGPNGEVMHVGLIRLIDLYRLYKDMGKKFFERNIRYGLGSGEAVNRAISRSLKSIVLDGKESPEVFAFNHNGISLFAEKIDHIDGYYHIVAPRLLNGAQTVTTFSEFYESNSDNPKLIERKSVTEALFVLCKIITEASQDFVTNVTINNNRQNPVEPWNLHANDMIQLQIQDKFIEDGLGIYYERQENAFQGIDMDEEGIKEAKAIELVQLAQTFLVTDGNIQRLSNMRQVFEDDNVYSQVFNQSRLKPDSRAIVLCYKTQFRLRRLIKDILDKGYNKYAYAPKARILLWALLCQGILNDGNLQDNSENFGTNMSIPADFTDYLSGIATKNCRFLLSELIANEKYQDKFNEGNFSFLRTNHAYEFCMEVAYKKWKWVQKKLNK